MQAILKPEQRKRERPRTVREVGKGREKCTHKITLPVTLLNGEGHPNNRAYDTQTVPGSQLPALLGLNAARESRMIIDTEQSRVYMAGPGDYNRKKAWPPRTQQVDCGEAPSGHLMLPCAEVQTQPANSQKGRLQLTPQQALPVETVHSGPKEITRVGHHRLSGRDGPFQHDRTARVGATTSSKTSPRRRRA